MTRVLHEDDEIRIPAWVTDLASFRRWTEDDDFPESRRISFLLGEVWIDPQTWDEQVAWLRADEAAHPNACTLAYWHEPLFSTGSSYDQSEVFAQVTPPGGSTPPAPQGRASHGLHLSDRQPSKTGPVKLSGCRTRSSWFATARPIGARTIATPAVPTSR